MKMLASIHNSKRTMISNIIFEHTNCQLDCHSELEW